jgi:hypothetical protein
VQKSSQEPKEGIHESNRTYKERDSKGDSTNKLNESIKWDKMNTSKTTNATYLNHRPSPKHQEKKVQFFLKYSQQLELEKRKLLLRIKKLESDNQELEERFRGSIDQREQIKDSADKVMNMLSYLNQLIDKFVQPTIYNSNDPSKSEKAILMDNLCKEKMKFDENMLGIKHKINMKKTKEQPPKVVYENSRNRRTYSESSQQECYEVPLKENSLQSELNESIKKLENMKNELEDSVLKIEKRPYTIEIDKKELDSLVVKKDKIKSMYFSEEKGLDCIPLDLKDLEKTHKTEAPKRNTRNLFKSKGRREKVNISISECNRLFRETLPNSKSRKRSRRKKSKKRSTKTYDSISQTNSYFDTKRSVKDTKSSVESHRYYGGLYNRNNSLFKRNRLNLNSKESELGNDKGINVWDKYNMTLPGSNETKDSKIPLSQTSKYENSRFVDSINKKELHFQNDLSFNSDKVKQKKEKIEFGVLKEKKLLQVKSDEEDNPKKEKIESNQQENSQEIRNYLRPSDSLRQRLCQYTVLIN